MNQLINNDYSRCDNFDCAKKENCKRFMQHLLDKSQKEIKPVSTVTFNDVDCEKHINMKK